jgi:Ku70/Ku80 beta-barrel domain
MVKLESANQQIGSGTTMHKGTLMYDPRYGVPSWLLVRTGRDFCAFPLVSCPIALYPATSEREKIHFHQLNRKTGNRIQYRKVETKDMLDLAKHIIKTKTGHFKPEAFEDQYEDASLLRGAFYS